VVESRPKAWQPPPAPRPWRWLRWALPLAGAALLVAGVLLYDGYLRPRLGFGGRDSPPFWFALALMVLAAGAACAAFRLPWRRFLPLAVGLQVLGAVVLAGVWMAFGPALLGGCGYTPSDSSWTDPALYSAMPNATLQDGDELRFTPAEGELPFTKPGLAPGEVVRLRSVSWLPPQPQELVGGFLSNPTPVGGFVLHGDRTVTVEADERAGADHLRHFAVRFLGNVTTLPAGDVAALADALVARREPAGTTTVTRAWDEERGRGTYEDIPLWLHTVQVPDALRLHDLYNETRLQQEPWPWSFDLTIPSWLLLSNDGPSVSVDQSGAAFFAGWKLEAKSDAAFERGARDWLAQRGLPAPSEMPVSGSIC
jgi:hypothetical protein